MLPTRLGNYTTTSHRLCNEVLRSRQFGPSPEDGSEDLANKRPRSFLARTQSARPHANPPTRRTGVHAEAHGWLCRIGRQAIQRLLDRCERDREFDLMTSFASPLPIAVMTHLLGLPNDPERFRRLGSTIARALDGIWSLGQARTLAAADAELRATFTELLEHRRPNPAMIWCRPWWLSRAGQSRGGAVGSGAAAVHRGLRDHCQRDR